MGSRPRVLLTLAGIVFGVWVVGVLGLQRYLLFPRYAVPVDPRPGEGIPGLERLTIDTEDGVVEAFLIPGDGVSAEHPGPAVIFAHGNAEIIDYWTHTLADYRAMGITVLLPEYRGYGRSAGSPSEVAITADYVRFHDALVSRPEVDSARVVFHGRSLGGGVVCALAIRRRPTALILQSSFRSVAILARRYLAPRFLVLDPFDNEAALHQLGEVPLLIVHGRHDAVIPLSHAQTLARIGPHSKLVLYDAGHNDCPPDPSVFWRDVRRWTREFLEAQRVVPKGDRPPGTH